MAATSNDSIYIPLEGVESEHCALTVDRGLNKVPGIITHRVELNNRRAVIDTQDLVHVLPNAVQSIRDLGYDVDSVKKNFSVLGMTCASCASSSQSILENLPGVLKVSVNYANSMAQVEYFPAIATPEKMKAALQSIGYDLVIDETNDAKDQVEQLHLEKYSGLKRKTLGAVLLSIPITIVGMFFERSLYSNYIMWVLATPVVFLFGKQFFVNAFKQAKHRSANMDTLVALSTGVAYLFSVFNTLFPSYLNYSGLQAHVYFEAAAVVIAFILLGKLLEENAKNNTSSALKKLIGLQPKTVIVIHEGGHQMEMPIAGILVGELLLAKPGERIAVDGIVQTGSSFVDESMMSGEPIPVEKVVNNKVYAGTINLKGSFQYRAEKIGGDTVLAHIIQMVQNAQGSRAPVQKLVDKIAGIFVPIVIGVAALSLVFWIVFGGENGVTHGLIALVTVLVIACPCALGLATPTAIMAGVGKGAENGILIKDAESLELARRINAVVLDKTGTITEGKPVVTDVLWLNDDLTGIPVLTAIESQSEHPLAEAVLNHFNPGAGPKVEKFESLTGLGARGEVDGKLYFVGNDKLLDQNVISIDTNLKQSAERWLKEAKTVIYFASEKEALAIIAIADKVKESSKSAVEQLQRSGIEVYMLTGDNEATAKAISESVGVIEYKAEVLPDQKAAFIKDLQAKGNVVAMVGDGINDSTALAQADISIAMGKGSDIAMEVAKMTIISSDLRKIPQAIQLSKYTVNTIRQNLFWAFIYNIIGIPIAAGILYSINGFLLNPMIAGAAMALSSVSVVSNSLRLKFKHLSNK